MKNYSLPTRKECFEIIEKYHVPQHIVRHSMAVTKLGVFLAQKLKEKGIAIDVELVERACLLHDVVRICEFKEFNCDNFGQTVTEHEKTTWNRLKAKFKGISHEYAAYALLKEKYPVLALTVRKHRYAALLDEAERPKTWEEKLVYYADKRVMHDKVVALKERLQEAHDRNVHLYQTQAQGKIDTAEVDRLIFELEQEIFAEIGLNPVRVTDESIGGIR
jgi:uncharacterized protein